MSHILPVDWSIYGRSKFVLDHLVGKVGHIASMARVRAFYIGKTSGSEPFHELVRRDDILKMAKELNIAIAVFQTPDSEYADAAEETLIESLSGHHKMLNRHRRGRMSPLERSLKYVYMACRMICEPEVDEFYDDGENGYR